MVLICTGDCILTRGDREIYAFTRVRERIFFFLRESIRVGKPLRDFETLDYLRQDYLLLEAGMSLYG